MVSSPNKDAQIHVRVTRALKKAIKMHCVGEDTTEQAWISKLVNNELARKAPNLWPKESSAPRKRVRRPRA